MITGTFLDEITHDIPKQNWGPEEWAADFRHMKAIGIDTVILIRAGYRDQCTFDSKVISKLHRRMINGIDLVDLYLRLAEENDMSFFFGTYDSGDLWNNGKYNEEIDINLAFADEVIARYGDRKAFKGWYISHEINSFNEGMMKVYGRLANHLRELKNLPILISPYIRGIKQFGAEGAISLDQHEKEWREVFSRIAGQVDIVAFQDGHVHYSVLPDYLEVNAALAREHKIECWSNVESFGRDMPFNFPPLGWNHLRYKIDVAREAGVDKLITFEFSHFMSPQSCWPAAHGLYNRYREHYCK